MVERNLSDSRIVMIKITKHISQRTKILILIVSILSTTISVNYAQMKPEDTEDWSRIPLNVSIQGRKKIPSDAIVLFDGKTDLNKWEHINGDEVNWKTTRASFRVEPGTGDIQTKQQFGDIQLHIEWKTPNPKNDTGFNKGNSGVFLMGLYEVQIYESFYNEIYCNGQAGSIYKQHIPLVNASRKPQKWQSFDIVFKAPKFNDDQSLKEPAYITVFQNGILIINHAKIKGPMKYIGHPKYIFHKNKMPLRLQEHNSKVSFRNIWVRELSTLKLTQDD